MRGIERIRQLDNPIQQAVQRRRAGTEAAVKRLALEQLHRDERLLIPVLKLHLLDRINSADIRMVQRRGRARLQQKTVESILIARKLRRQKLQRNLTPQIKICLLYTSDSVRSHPGHAELPVVIISDTPEKADVSLRSRKAQKVLLVPKPFTGTQVARALAQLLE